MKNNILITGGAGFIGGCFVRMMAHQSNCHIINVDKLTYAGNLDSLSDVDAARHSFFQADICDQSSLDELFAVHQPIAVFHFAAESHVDRSIDGPLAFVQTNVMGTATLLESCRNYVRSLSKQSADAFRFIHVSTDEVFGSLGATGYFNESTPYSPRSPYSASKAGSDHLVRAYHETYGLPVLITNCSNNYGPFQFPEKLIPLITLNAIEGKPLPVYGDGLNVRDWLYVEDHCRAIETVWHRGRVGETYTIGGDCEQTNLAIVKTICETVQALLPSLPHRCKDLIQYVSDRPGHDRRYAIDASKIREQLGWKPLTSFEEGIRSTVEWYIDNPNWIQRISDGSYRRERLGLGA